jgi:hypothetical protein
MVRAMVERPIERAELEQVLEAARWAPNAGNRHLHRFVVVQDPLTLRVLRMVAPGMFQRPAAVVVICIDQDRAVSFGMRPTAKGLYIDVGTAAQTMLLAAHSIGPWRRRGHVVQPGCGPASPEPAGPLEPGAVRVPRVPGRSPTAGDAGPRAGHLAEPD